MSRHVMMRWHLRQVMAARGMFQTSELVPLLAERGVHLTRQYVHRLVTTAPQRINIDPRRVVRHPGLQPGRPDDPGRGGDHRWDWHRHRRRPRRGRAPWGDPPVRTRLRRPTTILMTSPRLTETTPAKTAAARPHRDRARRLCSDATSAATITPNVPRLRTDPAAGLPGPDEDEVCAGCAGSLDLRLP